VHTRGTGLKMRAAAGRIGSEGEVTGVRQPRRGIETLDRHSARAVSPVSRWPLLQADQSR